MKGVQHTQKMFLLSGFAESNIGRPHVYFQIISSVFCCRTISFDQIERDCLVHLSTTLRL